jgi:hypothetical protein
VAIDLIPDELIRNISAGLTVLTSMITAALLISASGAFILSTSNRLGRVIDRVRKLSDDMDQLMQEGQSLGLLGIGGACLLFVGSVMMIYEARMAISTLAAENRFLDKLVEFHTRNRLTSS